jgi:hypothetical protein
MIGFVMGPVGIGIAAGGFILALFAHKDQQHHARYGMILGATGIITGIIASIVQLILMGLSILKWLKVLAIIKLILSSISNLFGIGL